MLGSTDKYDVYHYSPESSGEVIIISQNSSKSIVPEPSSSILASAFRRPNACLAMRYLGCLLRPAAEPEVQNT